MKALRVFDGMEPIMGKAGLMINNLEKHVLSRKCHFSNLAYNFVRLAEEDFYSRWCIMATNLHHVGAMLNLYKLDELRIYEDVAVKLCF